MQTKECWSCGKFKAFYTKGYWQFDKTELGLCIQVEKVCEKHNSCAAWCNKEMRRQIRKKVALKGLISTLETLSQINQILIDESKDSEE